MMRPRRTEYTFFYKDQLNQNEPRLALIFFSKNEPQLFLKFISLSINI